MGMNIKVSKIRTTTLVKCRSARVCPERLKTQMHTGVEFIALWDYRKKYIPWVHEYFKIAPS